MRFDPEDLEPSELAFRFETNGMISPSAFGIFLHELERAARLKSHFGPEAEVRIVALGTGSLWGKILIAGLTAAASVAAIGDFALALEERINRPRAAIAQCVAEMAIDSGVVSVTLTTQGCQVTVHTKDLPAIQHVQQKREAAAASQRLSHDTNVIDAIRIGDGTTPAAGTAPKTFGERPFGEGSYGGTARITGGYFGDGDKRGAINLIGRLSRPTANKGAITFVTEGGARYSADLAEDVAISDLIFDSKIIIRANHDPGSNWLLIWDVLPIGEL